MEFNFNREAAAGRRLTSRSARRRFAPHEPVSEGQPHTLTMGRDLSDLEAFQALRHEVFARELCWVPQRADALESDRYDAHSIHVGMRHGRCAAAYLRITPHHAPWMLFECFDFLLDSPDRCEQQPDSIEISRLAVDARYRARTLEAGHSAIDLLIFGTFQFSLHNGIRYWFVVVAEPVHRLLLRKGIACQPLGPVVRMPDGVHTRALRVDVDQLRNDTDCSLGGSPYLDGAHRLGVAARAQAAA